MKNIVIIYHADCPDGFSGAWAAWKKFGTKAEYIAAQHGSLPPRLTKKEIYLIDFMYPKAITRDLIAKNTRVTAIDHHVSAKENVELTTDYSYAVNHSGAVLAWNYFYKTPAPLLLRYVEDNDIWKFKLPHAKAITSFLKLSEFSFSVWDRLSKDFQSKKKLADIVEKGKLLLTYENKLIDDIVEKGAELVSFMGIKTLAVNSQNFGSQIGARLTHKLPPMGIVWRKKDGEIRVSLRSNGKVDVSKLAAKIPGGGGHKKASGFSFKFNPGKSFPWKYL